MKCVTREVKIIPRRQSRRDWLDRLFLEGKWAYNYYLQLHKAGDKWGEIPTRDAGVIVKYPMGYETRTLYAITSGMKQGIRDRLKANEKSIITNVRKGNIAHGNMHYISELNSIPLKQGCREGEKMQTYRLMDDHKHVRFQGDNRSWKIIGGEQIPRDAELANGKLVRVGQDYYLHITFFVEWSEEEKKAIDEMPSKLSQLIGAGLDFGIETNITTNDGEKFNWWFGETERLKKAQQDNENYRAWHRREYGWARSSNTQVKIMREEYAKIGRRKQDAINKFLHHLKTLDGPVAVQQEQIKGWHADERYSDVVQHSVMGGIMKRLIAEPSTLVVSKWVRSTGVCPDCGHVLDEKLSLDVREWDCPECGVHHDRDEAAARVIFLLAAVSSLYPDCPAGMEDEVFYKLLGVLGMDVPVTSNVVPRPEGLNSGRLRTAVGIEH